jgi:hypothetical protein
VLILSVFPFGADALFEEVVVGFEAELRAGCDIILRNGLVSHKCKSKRLLYIDSPELLNGVKGDHFLQQIVPVVAFATRWFGEP